MKSATNRKIDAHRSVYTKAFFQDLFSKLSTNDKAKLNRIKEGILLAEKQYLRDIQSYEKQIPAHIAKKKIKKIRLQLDSTHKELSKLFNSNWSYPTTIALLAEIEGKHPELKGFAQDLYPDDEMFRSICSNKILTTLAALSQALKIATAKAKPLSKNKSLILENWLTSFSSVLEDAFDRPLKNRKYDGGRYSNNKGELYDSDLLLYIIKPIAPKTTLSQIETALKSSRGERLNPPWLDYL